MPHLQQLAGSRKLSDRGLLVWAVNADEEKQTVESFVKENKFTFTVPLGTGAALKPYKIDGIPTTFIVGRDGIVKDVFVGYGEGSAKLIDDAVQKALAEPPPAKQ